MKFGARSTGVAEWKVTPLETLWWDTSGRDLFGAGYSTVPKEMAWRALLMHPEVVTADMLEQAKAEVVGKKKSVPAIPQVRLETWTEGLCVQTMHVGPYAGECPTVELMRAWMTGNGYQTRGRHHEVYLSDPNRTTPERMKTILRLLVEKVQS
jgi:hypothetical protein